MVSFSAFTLFVAIRSLLLIAPALLVRAVPVGSHNMTSNVSSSLSSASSSGYWLANIKHQGIATFNKDSTYKIFRNVKTDCGAAGKSTHSLRRSEANHSLGDGTTDDITKINDCISNGNRCGGFQGYTPTCNSSTTTPAIIYFPPGKYYISTPIVQYYYTQLIGDATDPPTIVAAPGFNQNNGGSVIDADPYISGSGTNWYVNQVNAPPMCLTDLPHADLFRTISSGKFGISLLTLPGSIRQATFFLASTGRWLKRQACKT